MNGNVVTASFQDGRITLTAPLWQYDYGQILRFTGVSLPETYEVHFSNTKDRGNAKTAIGNANGVFIPDEFLTTGGSVFAWVFLHTGEDDGETEYRARIPVNKRAMPSDEVPTPQERSVITQAIAALNAAVESTSEGAASSSVSATSAEISAANASASASGAETAAVNAAVSESEAKASASAAAQAATQAVNAAEAAMEKAMEADVSAQSANSFASSASSSAQAAGTSATSAGESAQSASASAATAAAAETAAGSSAQTASGAANTCVTKTDEANASATAALNAKTAAQTAQIAAEAAQTLAESAAETAQSASENVEEKVADVVGIKQDLMMDHELTALLVDSTENNLTDSQGNRLETRVVFSDVDTVSALASELKASEQVTQRRIVDLETDVRKLCQGEEALGVHIDTVKADVEKLEGNLLIGQDITYQLLDNAGEPLLTGSGDALLGHTVFVSMDLLTVLANRVIALETLINAQK